MLVDTGKGYIQDRRKYNRMPGLCAQLTWLDAQFVLNLDRRKNITLWVEERRLADRRKDPFERRQSFNEATRIVNSIKSLERRQNSGRRFSKMRDRRKN